METPNDPRFRIVDAGSNDELVQLGMDVRPKARICRECRFWLRGESPSPYSTAYDPDYDKCEAVRRSYCNEVNPKGECELWEPNPPPDWTSFHDRAFGVLLGTVFGGVVVSLIWLLAGGG